MAAQLHLPEPCGEQWSTMQKVSACKRHCAVCNTPVHDLSKKSLPEIHQLLNAKANEIYCGNYHERHIRESKRVYVFVNKLEEKLLAVKLKRVSIILITAVLFFSGCVKRQVRGRMKVLNNEKNKKQEIYQA